MNRVMLAVAVGLWSAAALASPAIEPISEDKRLKDADVVLEGKLVSNGGVDEPGVRKLFAVVNVTKVSGPKAKDWKPGDYTFEGKCSTEEIPETSPAAKGGYPTGHCPGAGLPGPFGDNPGADLKLLFKVKGKELTWVPSESPQLYFATGKPGKHLPPNFKDGLTQLAPLPEPKKK